MRTRGTRMSTAPGYRPRGHSLRTTAAVLLTSLALAEAAVAAPITVEVENRFRTIRGAEQERRFREEYDTYLRNAEIARLHYAEPSRTNYPTHWLAANAQYDQRWIHDPKRAVRLSVDDTGRDARCRWSIDGKEVGDTSCQGARAEIQLGERAVRVTVTRSDGSQFRDEQVVRLKDTLIVAIGDSYGAGEGVPHVLRRPPMSRGNRGRPAGWWDQRCHRSLFAGASLAAANRAERGRPIRSPFSATRAPAPLSTRACSEPTRVARRRDKSARHSLSTALASTRCRQANAPSAAGTCRRRSTKPRRRCARSRGLTEPARRVRVVPTT